MRRCLKSLVVGLFVSMSACVMAGQKLIVGTCATFAPFEYLGGITDTIEGFDIDLSQEIAKRGGYTLEIVNMGFDGLIPAILSRSIHMAASGITITEKRAKRVNFSEPYYEAGQDLLVRKKDAKQLTSLEKLAGKTIGVQIATTGAEVARSIPGATVKTFNAGAEAIIELKNGGCDAVIFDRPVISYFLVKNPMMAMGLKQLRLKTEAEFFGFAFNKADKELLQKVNTIMKEMKKDGTFDSIYKKWFGR